MGFLTDIVEVVNGTISSGYYDNVKCSKKRKSLVDAIKKSKKFPIICEVKPFSPSHGRLIYKDPLEIADEMIKGGAAGLSVLTEPKHFGGNIRILEKDFKVPILMKDFVISKRQIIGGDAVLLIAPLLNKVNVDPNELITYAHSKGIETLLEVNTIEEFRQAKKTETDLIGINNRDLETLAINLDTTVSILKMEKADRLVVSESGIETREDIVELRKSGANAALIGTSILKASDIREKIKELLS